MEGTEGGRVDLLIAGGLVVTMDERRTPIRDGALAVHGNRIAGVGPRARIEAAYRADRRIDAGGGIILPGLVNAHTHVAMTIFRGLADDLPLDVWLQQHIWPAERRHLSAE